MAKYLKPRIAPWLPQERWWRLRYLMIFLIVSTGPAYRPLIAAPQKLSLRLPFNLIKLAPEPTLASDRSKCKGLMSFHSALKMVTVRHQCVRTMTTTLHWNSWQFYGNQTREERISEERKGNGDQGSKMVTRLERLKIAYSSPVSGQHIPARTFGNQTILITETDYFLLFSHAFHCLRHMLGQHDECFESKSCAVSYPVCVKCLAAALKTRYTLGLPRRHWFR